MANFIESASCNKKSLLGSCARHIFMCSTAASIFFCVKHTNAIAARPLKSIGVVLYSFHTSIHSQVVIEVTRVDHYQQALQIQI